MLRQAVFLVGGLGTRLGKVAQSTPKPLLRVAGRPFIDYLIDEAVRHGFDDIVLLAGHLGAQVEAQYQKARRRGATIRVVREPRPMGTGGAVRLAVNVLDDLFVLCNGDTFFDINLRALPLPDRGEVSMALRAAVPGARYGTVSLQAERVSDFHRPEDNVPGPINAGIYVMSSDVVAEFPEQPSSIENDQFPRLARAGRIRAAAFDRFFIDIGVAEDLERAQHEMAARTRRPAVFFDRDGVLNVDRGYVHRWEEFEWLRGAREAVRMCNDRGYLVFVVTNQAGVAHGHYAEDAVKRLHARVAEELAAVGAHVEEFEYCPHHPTASVARYRRVCDRRKPGPGMIRDLLARWNVDVERSLLIGDQSSDLEAAAAAGIAGHQYGGGDLCEFVARRIG